MRPCKTLAILFALFTLLLPATLAQQYRIPNTLPDRQFPRWLPQLNSSPDFLYFRDMVVDSRNTVHFVYTALDSIRYRNNRHETRSSNSFSPPFTITSGNSPDRPAIAIDQKDNLFIVWQQLKDNPYHQPIYDIYFRSLKDNLWQPLRLLSQASATLQDNILKLTSYSVPDIAIDQTGGIHIIAIQHYSERDLTTDTLLKDVYTLLYSYNLSPLAEVVASGDRTAGDQTPLAIRHVIRTDPSNRPHIAWAHGVIPDKINLLHSSKNTTWSKPTKIASILFPDYYSPEYFTNFDFQPDPDGTLHFAYADADQGKVKYRKLKNTQLSPPELVSLTGFPAVSVRIDLDLQNIPHVFWSKFSPCNNYAVRVANPAQPDDPGDAKNPYPNSSTASSTSSNSHASTTGSVSISAGAPNSHGSTNPTLASRIPSPPSTLLPTRPLTLPLATSCLHSPYLHRAEKVLPLTSLLPITLKTPTTPIYPPAGTITSRSHLPNTSTSITS
jgi:hypothetical protein